MTPYTVRLCFRFTKDQAFSFRAMCRRSRESEREWAHFIFQMASKSRWGNTGRTRKLTPSHHVVCTIRIVLQGTSIFQHPALTFCKNPIFSERFVLNVSAVKKQRDNKKMCILLIYTCVRSTNFVKPVKLQPNFFKKPTEKKTVRIKREYRSARDIRNQYGLNVLVHTVFARDHNYVSSDWKEPEIESKRFCCIIWYRFVVSRYLCLIITSYSFFPSVLLLLIFFIQHVIFMGGVQNL